MRLGGFFASRRVDLRRFVVGFHRPCSEPDARAPSSSWASGMTTRCRVAGSPATAPAVARRGQASTCSRGGVGLLTDGLGTHLESVVCESVRTSQPVAASILRGVLGWLLGRIGRSFGTCFVVNEWRYVRVVRRPVRGVASHSGALLRPSRRGERFGKGVRWVRSGRPPCCARELGVRIPPAALGMRRWRNW